MAYTHVKEYWEQKYISYLITILRVCLTHDVYQELRCNNSFPGTSQDVNIWKKEILHGEEFLNALKSFSSTTMRRYIKCPKNLTRYTKLWEKWNLRHKS